MKPISLDLRKRVMDALQTEPSSLIVARRFKVSSSFVRKLRIKVRQTGSMKPRSKPGKERLVKGEDEQLLRRLVARYPDATLNVLREMLEDEGGVVVSETTMWRQLLRMGITLKKRSYMPQSATDRT